MDLKAWLEAAWADYQGTWAVVDGELYSLCARRRHDRLEDVYAKVAMINRVYAAGLSRSVRVPAPGDPERVVADGLRDCRELLVGGLAAVDEAPGLSSGSLGPILDLHWAVQAALEERAGRRLTSFVSKYLHFHCPCFPIYDSLAWRAIGDVTRDHTGRPGSGSMSPSTAGRGDDYYRSYCTRFLAVYELARADGVPVSVKMLDHALWSHGRRINENARADQIGPSSLIAVSGT